nr:MAG TPA: anaerobic ribonucleoside triphosphate reductase [Caudoviricetes sp.]
MEINVKLYSPFVATLNKLKKKYGEEFEKLNGLHNDQLSFTDFIDHFIDSDNTANASIDGNANVKQQDICSLENEMNKPHQKLLSYNKIFYEITKKYGLKTAEEWLENEWNGAFYLHDGYSASFKSYCFAYDLEDLVHKGLYFVDGFGGGAPQHLTTFMSHVKEFTSWTSNRTSGACGLPTLLVHAYYFWKHDVENGYYLVSPEYYRDQCFQELIYGLNQPYLRVNQCSFTNVTIMDRPYLTEIFGGRQYPDGTYVIDYIEEIIQFQKDFMRVVSEIRQKDMFTFPVLTYSLLYQNGKFVDEEFARWASDHNSLWCDSNFFVGDSVTSLSSCCRLVNQFDKLDGFINSIGGTALKIGSVKVNTINLARIALEANKDKNKFLSILKERTTLDLKVLDVVRHIIIRNVEKGLLPNYTHNLIDIKNQYNTIGVNAMMEAIDTMGMLYQDEIGNYHYTDEGLNFSCEILDTINAIKDEFAKDKDYSVNVEAVPAERCASVNCAKDNILYPNQIHETLYSNQWIALATPTSINERIRLASVLDKKCGGGQILHVNCDTPFTDKDVAWDVLNYIAKSGVIYFAFNTKISSCENGHGFYGEVCPTCGKEKTDTFSRIVGFLVPTSQYSKARSKEYAKRYWYDMKDDI